MVTPRLLSTAETLSRSARFPGKIFPSSRLKSPQAIPVITVPVATCGKPSVDHVGRNPLKVIQLLPLPTSKPTASGNPEETIETNGLPQRDYRRDPPLVRGQIWRMAHKTLPHRRQDNGAGPGEQPRRRWATLWSWMRMPTSNSCG